MTLAASGLALDVITPKLRSAERAALDLRLRTPQPERPNIERCRAALTDRAEHWKAELRGEPQLARLLVGPLTLWDAATPSTEWSDWEASITPSLLEGLVQGLNSPIHLVTSPTGFVSLWTLLRSQFQKTSDALKYAGGCARHEGNALRGPWRVSGLPAGV